MKPEMLFLTLFWITSSGTAFKVTAPSKSLVALKEGTVMLGCIFTPDRTSDMNDLTVTWQRAEDSRVVHSFYYGVDQLDRQNHEYKDRTALYPSELEKGNASLRISGIRVVDAGLYLCTVSNQKGADKAQVQLHYAAFYSEPRLNIEVNLTHVSVVYETEGYPKAEVSWKDAAGQQLPHHTSFSPSGKGLFSLRTKFVPPDKSNNTLNLTFTLTNRHVEQVLTRVVCFNKGNIILERLCVREK